MAAFSFSRIGSYENCKLQYKYQYIDKIKVKAKDTIETYLGSLVHEALERLYRDTRYEKLLSEQELLDFYNRKWDESWEDTIIIAKKEYSPENYRKMGEKYLKDYYKKHHPFEEGKIIGLETQNYLTLDEAGEYKYHVRIDRLMDMGNGNYEVHDYKSGMNLSTQEDLDKDRQLAMYSLWVRERFKDFKKVRLVWHFLAFDKEMDSYRTAEQLEDLKNSILEEIKKIEATEEFPPNESYLCSWCLYREICPLWKHEASLEEKTVNEYMNDPGVKLVDEYANIKSEYDVHRKEAEKKLSKLREAILTFSKNEGVQVIAGTENKISIKESEYYRFPGKNTEMRNKLEQELKKAKRFDDVAVVDTYALNRILKEQDGDDDLLAILKEFAEKEKSYILSLGKK
jgi:putative RecB family exonuclease